MIGGVKTIHLLIITLCLWVIGISTAFAAEHVPVHSDAMNRDVNNMIILPASYDGKREFPVIYLLHGHGMQYFEWLRVQRDLPKLADHYGIILVCPDAGNSWYWDSPVNPASRFETYVACELPAFIKSKYKTIDSKDARAITGLSMGGHGALWLAIRHQDVFGACGSMSGAVDIRPFPRNWNIADSLGKYEDNPARWDAHTVMTQLPLIKPGLAIIIDCGTGDFFFEVNEKLHRELLARKIPHDYISRPGAHNGAYWRNAVLYQILFFSEIFNKRCPR